jgi:putative two-component system response regulator
MEQSGWGHPTKSMFDDLIRSKILIVDDEPVNVLLLERVLEESGYGNIFSMTDSTQVLALYKKLQPDLILLDLLMPRLDGFAVMKQLGETTDPGDYMPILVLTADITNETKQRALSSGAMDFLVKPFDVSEVLLRIKNLLHTRLLHLRIREYNEQLEQKVRERTRELAESKVEILERLAIAGEYRDQDTGAHTRRVGNVAAAIAEATGIEPWKVELIRRAATLHDIGKIGIPDLILLKPGKLDVAEFEVMKSHTRIGAKILSGSRDALLRMAECIAMTHHEWWDGSGYPSGLSGIEIPIEGRVVALADALDALTHERPYKLAWPLEAALVKIQEQSGKQFDPTLVDILLRLLSCTDLAALALATSSDDAATSSIAGLRSPVASG